MAAPAEFIDLVNLLESYGLDIEHGDARITIVNYRNGDYDFSFQIPNTYLLKGDTSYLKEFIITELMKHAAEKAVEEYKSNLRNLLGVKQND